jgi:hypothetical protein
LVLASRRPRAGGADYVEGAGRRDAWRHDAATWSADIAVLLALTFGSIGATWFTLRRLDPNVEGRRWRRGPPVPP